MAGSDDNLFNGDGCLYPGDELSISVTVEVNPTCIGPSVNQWTIQPLLQVKTQAQVSTYSDDSDDAIPTLTELLALTMKQVAQTIQRLLSISKINVAKEQVSMTNLPNGNVEVQFQMVVQNTGNATLSSVILEDDVLLLNMERLSFLPQQFPFQERPLLWAAPTVVLQEAEQLVRLTADGDDILDRSAVLAPGEYITAVISVVIDPNNVPGTGLTNQATVQGTDPIRK